MAALGNRSMWTVSVTASLLLHAGLALTFATALSFRTVPPRETRISMEAIDAGLPLGDLSEPVRRDAIAPEPPRSADLARETDDAAREASSSEAVIEDEADAAAAAPDTDTAMRDDGAAPPAERPAEELSVTRPTTPETSPIDGDTEARAIAESETASAVATAELAPSLPAAGEVADAEIPGATNAAEFAPPTETVASVDGDAGLTLTEPLSEAAEVPGSVTDDVAVARGPDASVASEAEGQGIEPDDAVDAASTSSTEPQQSTEPLEEVAEVPGSVVGDVALADVQDVFAASEATGPALVPDAVVDAASAISTEPQQAAEPVAEVAEAPRGIVGDVAAADALEVAGPGTEPDNLADAAPAASTEPLQAATADLVGVTEDLVQGPVGAAESVASVPGAASAVITLDTEPARSAVDSAEATAATIDPVGAVAEIGPIEAVGPLPAIAVQANDGAASERAADISQGTEATIAATVEIVATGPSTVTDTVLAPPLPDSAVAAPSVALPSAAVDDTEETVAVGAQIGAPVEVESAEAISSAPASLLAPADDSNATLGVVEGPPLSAEAYAPAADIATPGSVAIAETASADLGVAAAPASADPAVAASESSDTVTPAQEEAGRGALTSDSVLEALAPPVEGTANVGNGAASTVVGAGGDSLEASASGEIVTPAGDAAAPVETALLSPASSADALAPPPDAPAIEAEPLPPSPGGEGAVQQTADRPADPVPAPTSPQDAAAEARRALQVRIASVVDYLVGYEGGNCFVAFPELNSKGELRISAFAADTAIGSDLGARLSSTVGFDVPVATSAISEPQCSALRFTQLVGDARARRPIRIVLDRTDVANGEPLSGRILGGSGEPIHLLIVDDEGAVQNVDRYVRQGENGITFDPPVFLTGGAVATVQLLVAVASREELDTIVRLKKTEADGFFSMLTSEMRNMQLMATIAVAAFNVR